MYDIQFYTKIKHLNQKCLCHHYSINIKGRNNVKGRRDRMVVGFRTTCAISEQYSQIRLKSGEISSTCG
jgi:hypothetical protein